MSIWPRSHAANTPPTAPTRVTLPTIAFQQAAIVHAMQCGRMRRRLKRWRRSKITSRFTRTVSTRSANRRRRLRWRMRLSAKTRRSKRSCSPGLTPGDLEEKEQMSKAKRTALVTGASGLAGGYMLAHLLEQGGWDVVAVSRRKPRIPGDYRHIAVDLVDQADCQAKLGPLTNITHLFYLAITERADPGETMSANASMFFNLVKTVDAASPVLEHVHLSQGTRWYGNHLGPYKTPTKEDDPRHMPPNFYYDQQDFLEEFQKGKRWTWSVGRPHAVCGFSTGGPMNLTLAIAVYANVCKALGLPLSFPGKPGAYTALYQCTDAALLAKAVEWMATDPRCANQAFNIPNSDLIRWQNVWPKFADFFGMELAPPRHINLVRSMADKGPIWEKIVEKNGLQKFRFEEIAAWGYPDGVFASDYDIVSDTSKARRFGFHNLVDTEEMFFRMFSDFRRERIIP